MGFLFSATLYVTAMGQGIRKCGRLELSLEGTDAFDGRTAGWRGFPDKGTDVASGVSPARRGNEFR